MFRRRRVPRRNAQWEEAHHHVNGGELVAEPHAYHPWPPQLDQNFCFFAPLSAPKSGAVSCITHPPITACHGGERGGGGAFVPFRRNMQVPTCVPPRCSHFCFAAQLCGIERVRSSFAYACRSAGDEQCGRAAKHERRRAPALLDLAGMVFGSHDSPRGRLRSGADGFFGTGPPFGATRSSFTLITPLEYLRDLRHSS